MQQNLSEQPDPVQRDHTLVYADIGPSCVKKRKRQTVCHTLIYADIGPCIIHKKERQTVYHSKARRHGRQSGVFSTESHITEASYCNKLGPYSW